MISKFQEERAKWQEYLRTENFHIQERKNALDALANLEKKMKVMMDEKEKDQAEILKLRQQNINLSEQIKT